MILVEVGVVFNTNQGSRNAMEIGVKNDRRGLLSEESARRKYISK